MTREQIPIRDELWTEDCEKGWTSEREALRGMVSIVAGLYESYRGGPFGVCQRTVRDIERQLFHGAQYAKGKWFADD